VEREWQNHNSTSTRPVAIPAWQGATLTAPERILATRSGCSNRFWSRRSLDCARECAYLSRGGVPGILPLRRS